MSYLLATLGRGLLAELLDAFRAQLPLQPDDDADDLGQRRALAPGSLDLGLRHGLALLRDGKLHDARRVLEGVRRLPSDSAQPALALACAYDALGLRAQTLDELREAARRDPRDPAIEFALALLHEREERLDEAARRYARAAELCPRLRNAHERLAALDVLRADFAAAAQRYDALQRLEPGDMELRLAHAGLVLLGGDAPRAVEIFQRALLVEPECGDEALRMADAVEDESQLREALAHLRKVIDKYPGISEFHVQLGDLYVRSGADDEAVQQYQAALDLHPDFLEATVKLGTQHLRRGRRVEAARWFNRAVELNDRLLTGFVGLGVAQRACGRDAEADASFDLAASLEPNSTLLLCETLRLSQGDRSGRPPRDVRHVESDRGVEREARRLRRALAASPQRADLHYRLGVLMRQAGEPALAQRAFEAAVRLTPGHAKAHLRLGLCLKESGTREQAGAAFMRALALDPALATTHYRLALLFSERDRFRGLVERFEHEHADEALRQAFRENLEVCLQDAGVVDRAAAAWRELEADAQAPADCSDGLRATRRDAFTRRFGA